MDVEDGELTFERAAQAAEPAQPDVHQQFRGDEHDRRAGRGRGSGARAAETVEYDRPWVVIVWNDPINLMSYVTLVFQKLFGFSLQKGDAG
mgnify:CR=1 FL=1